MHKPQFAAKVHVKVKFLLYGWEQTSKADFKSRLQAITRKLYFEFWKCRVFLMQIIFYTSFIEFIVSTDKTENCFSL